MKEHGGELLLHYPLSYSSYTAPALALVGGSIKHGSVHINTLWLCNYILVMKEWKNPMTGRPAPRG